jgi:hypothetical protein
VKPRNRMSPHRIGAWDVESAGPVLFGRRPASSVKELGECSRWTFRGLRGRHVGKDSQRKLGTTRWSPRRRGMTHSEGSAYKPLCGEVVLCRRVGRMGPIK